MRPFYFYILFIIIFAGCANQVPLEGGDKDVVPPKLVASVPDTFQLNFKGNKIVITFDEYIVLKNAVNELTISPPLKNPAEVKLKNKSVEVILKDSLEENTTYSLNFGNGIADNNEGNIAKNFTFIFSTGSYIDSLTMKGFIADAYSLKPIEDGKFMLYKIYNDSTPFKEKPYNLALTSNTGNAEIHYLPEARYRVFALKDLNNNSLYDLPSESIGFIDSLIAPSDSDVVKILMFNEKKDATKIKSAKSPYPGKVFFKLDGYGENILLEPLTEGISPVKGHIEWGNTEKDSLIYWYDSIAIDSIQLKVTIPDVGDTILLLFPKMPRNTRSTGVKGPTSFDSPFITTKVVAEGGIDYFKSPELLFSRPVKNIHKEKIIVLLGEDTIPFSYAFTDTVNRKLKLEFPLLQDSVYKLILQDSAVTDQYDHPLDSVAFDLKITKESDYSNFSLFIQHFEGKGKAIIQLLDKDDKLLFEKDPEITDTALIVKFEKLKAGNYKVKLIYDDNANGKWDTGSLALLRQPEKVSYFPQNIDIKPMFDLELSWDLKPVEGTGKSKF